jgi:glycosyltransferase involved in cell wall biosynthesis
LPYSLLEAMATETLVVTTRVGGIPDVVDATQAILVDPHSPSSLVEAIAWAVTNTDRATLKVQAALQRVEEAYLVERLAHDFVALYRSITARPV